MAEETQTSRLNFWLILGAYALSVLVFLLGFLYVGYSNESITNINNRVVQLMQRVDSIDDEGTEALSGEIGKLSIIKKEISKLEKRVDTLKTSIEGYIEGQNQANANLRCRLKQCEVDVIKVKSNQPLLRSSQDIDRHCGVLP